MKSFQGARNELLRQANQRTGGLFAGLNKGLRFHDWSMILSVMRCDCDPDLPEHWHFSAKNLGGNDESLYQMVRSLECPEGILKAKIESYDGVGRRITRHFLWHAKEGTLDRLATSIPKIERNGPPNNAQGKRALKRRKLRRKKRDKHKKQGRKST